MSDEVRAGTELDAELAERVMGWARWADLSADCPNEPGVTYFADWGESRGVAVYPHGDPTGDPAFYFNPSADMNDALKVVEKLREAGLYVAMNTTCDKGLYDVEVMDEVHFSCRGLSTFKPLPTAICLAARDAFPRREVR